VRKNGTAPNPVVTTLKDYGRILCNASYFEMQFKLSFCDFCPLNIRVYDIGKKEKE
jgi:hypothetical protein